MSAPGADRRKLQETQRQRRYGEPVAALASAEGNPGGHVYQLHIGVFYATDNGGRDIRPGRVANLLDALGRVDYLADLGITAIQPLPLVEFHGEWSPGYNGTDIFSPETDYCIPEADLVPYLAIVNGLLARKGRAELTHRFTRDLIFLRRRQLALRAEPITVYPSDNDNRVLAYHRWVEGSGRDVVVVASLDEFTLHDYVLGFPRPGDWLEVFNSDYYDHFPNQQVQGNGGSIVADGPGRHDMPCSASITIPANGLLAFVGA